MLRSTCSRVFVSIAMCCGLSAACGAPQPASHRIVESVGFDQRGDAATRAEHSGAISAATDGTAQRGLRASDVASPEALVRACYDVISGPAGPRDWERFLALFHPEFGRLVPVRTSRDGSTHSVFGITPAQYVENASVTFEANAFYERELSLRVQRFGAVAHAFSAYASYTSDAPDAEPVDRGVNSFQLFFDGARWFVLSISWDSEREGVVLEVG